MLVSVWHAKMCMHAAGTERVKEAVSFTYMYMLVFWSLNVPNKLVLRVQSGGGGGGGGGGRENAPHRTLPPPSPNLNEALPTIPYFLFHTFNYICKKAIEYVVGVHLNYIQNSQLKSWSEWIIKMDDNVSKNSYC